MLLIVIIFSQNTAYASQKHTLLRVATAANFAPILKKLSPQIEHILAVKLQIISASSGTLYQQIKYGAPFDVFLSADSLHPKKLVNERLAIASTLSTYTQGQLSFYSAKHPQLTANEFFNNPQKYNRIAIANPTIAPYGKATKSLLTNKNIWSQVSKHLVIGINVGQTFQQIRSKAVDLGFVATSQLVLNNIPVPTEQLSSFNDMLLQQQAVVINRSAVADDASKFVQFLTSQKVQTQLIEFGYLAINQQEGIHDKR